ncbi:MAG TPA: universal stress protein [Mucilaginibacter sp.]
MKIKKILIGIDDSKFAEHAAEYGFSIAQSFKAHVGLVHIIEPMVIPATTNSDILLGSPPQSLGINELEMLNIQNDVSETLIERTIKKFGNDLEVTHFNEYGDTADGIIQCSKEFNADLIVVGTHSRTGLDRFFMGSVAEHVVRHSEIPVLVVPFKESESK